MSHLYISTIGLPILLEEICRPIPGLYKSLTDTWMWNWGWGRAISRKGILYIYGIFVAVKLHDIWPMFSMYTLDDKISLQKEAGRSWGICCRIGIPHPREYNFHSVLLSGLPIEPRDILFPVYHIIRVWLTVDICRGWRWWGGTGTPSGRCTSAPHSEPTANITVRSYRSYTVVLKMWKVRTF